MQHIITSNLPKKNVRWFLYLWPARAGDCTRCGYPRPSDLPVPAGSKRERVWHRTSGCLGSMWTTTTMTARDTRRHYSRRHFHRGHSHPNRRTTTPPPRRRRPVGDGRRRARRTWGRHRPPPPRTLSRGRRLHPICGRTSAWTAARRWPAPSAESVTAHWSSTRHRCTLQRCL